MSEFEFKVFDDTFRVDKLLDDQGTGYVERDYQEDGLNAYGFCSARDIAPHSHSELLEIIAEKTAKKTWIRDKCDRVGSKVKNQSRSSYCWNHAPVRGVECNMVLQGGKAHTLSAFWGAATIKNGRNQGGWGLQAVKFMVERGVPLESFHKPMDFSVDRSPETLANAKLHQIVGWEDVDPSDQYAIFTRIALDIPVTLGIPAMGHEMLGTFLVVIGGKIYIGCDNSWGASDGDNGRRVCTGRNAKFSEAGCIISVEPSNN